MNILLEQANKELENLFTQNKNHVSENELYRMGKCKDIVLNILKTEYGAIYYPSDDAHFCGTWSFHHPKEKTEKYYELKYIRFDEKMDNFISFMKSTDIDLLLNEIMRLEFDKIYWHGTESEKQNCLDEINRNLLIRYPSKQEAYQLYVGTDGIWIICPSTYNYIPR